VKPAGHEQPFSLPLVGPEGEARGGVLRRGARGGLQDQALGGEAGIEEDLLCDLSAGKTVLVQAAEASREEDRCLGKSMREGEGRDETVSGLVDLGLLPEA